MALAHCGSSHRCRILLQGRRFGALGYGYDFLLGYYCGLGNEGLDTPGTF